MPTLTDVHHLALAVTDVDRSVPWYERVLELKEVARREDPSTGLRKVLLRDRTDTFSVMLVQRPETERVAFDRRHTGLDHLAFKVDSHFELQEWEQRLAEYGVTHRPITASRTLPGSSVLVFHDPDGIQLEVWADPAA
ncbi:glyoxalase [Amycolatopsis rhizosphaerae]|uniref:Glyoxalase n=1 Tax=Amycolatopsis rhizosphaerae TaxID=2053003 RepID=A0A558DL76_9PSEU|nr:VOC family protein [Amycolatopsis rhizosphaerae]TVT61763.1 glyoxalase [Amycolatopsis rhizosphaerae]